MIVSCHRSLFSVFIVYPSSAPKTRRSLKDCCHSFISVPLSTCHLFIYLYISPHSSSDLGVRRWVRGLWEALKIVYVSLRWIARLLKERSLVELHLFQFKTFFFCISLKDCVPKCPCASLFLIIPKLCPPSSVGFCRTLQTVGPSHARIYTVAVYFKGERIGCGKGPRWVRWYNIIRHKQDKAFSFSMHR